MATPMDNGSCSPTTAGAMTPTTTTGAMTPTTTIGPDQDIAEPADTAPWPGKTYKIRQHGSLKPHRFVTLEGGKLQLKPQDAGKGGCHWTCVEKDGFLGFRNFVSGQYLGRQEAESAIVANVYHHKAWEHWCVRRHPDGGYMMLVCHERNKLWPIEASKDGLKEVKDWQGTLWDFEEA